jgi:hypothetical protein
MSIDETTIRQLLDVRDDRGVLSIYVGHTPDRAAAPRPTAPIEVRNGLRDLISSLASTDPDLARAIEARVGSLDGELDRLLDPKSPGRGRALFVGIDSGEVHTVTTQVPFRDRVVHHDGPFVRPLVAAVDEGRAAGVVVVSRSGVRLLRWAVGEVEELTSDAFELTDAQLADVGSGPSPGNPQHPHHGYVDRERFEDRVDENLHRFLRDAFETVAARSSHEAWDRIVLSGPPKLRDSAAELLTDALPPGDKRPRVLLAEQAWEDASPSAIAEQIWPLLRSVHQSRATSLVGDAIDRTLGGNAGALGLRHVCEALNDGRVAHLLYDVDLQHEGHRAEDGTIHPRVEGWAAVADLELHREPLFVERMVERALATSAIVTPVDGAAAAALADHEGVGALLRW